MLNGWSVGRSRERGVKLCIVCCCSSFPRKRQQLRSRVGIKPWLLQHIKCMRWELTGCGCALKAALVGLNLHAHAAPRYNRCFRSVSFGLSKQQCFQYFSFRNDFYLSAAMALLSRLQSFPYQLGTDLKLIYHLFSCSGKAEHPVPAAVQK